MKRTDEPIIVEAIFESSVEKVWNAITNHPEMIEWYFNNIPDFHPKVGFETEFIVVSGEKNFLHQWEIKEVQRPFKIIYNWQYEGYEGSADVAFIISSVNDKTKLQVRVDVLEDFADDIPEFKRESCIGGWEYFINDRLNEYLKKN